VTQPTDRLVGGLGVGGTANTQVLNLGQTSQRWLARCWRRCSFRFLSGRDEKKAQAAKTPAKSQVVLRGRARQQRADRCVVGNRRGLHQTKAQNLTVLLQVVSCPVFTVFACGKTFFEGGWPLPAFYQLQCCLTNLLRPCVATCA
jgi:hypothetical protein